MCAVETPLMFVRKVKKLTFVQFKFMSQTNLLLQVLSQNGGHLYTCCTDWYAYKPWVNSNGCVCRQV